MRFKVQASNKKKQSVIFVLDAEDEKDVRRKLRSRGYLPSTAIIERLEADSELPRKKRTPVLMAVAGLFGTMLVSAAVVGITAEPFDPEVCRTEAGQLKHVQRCMGVLFENEYAWSHRDLTPDACKKYIGSIMGRDPGMMRTIASEPVVRIDYRRNDDGKEFTYECSTIGDDIVWRGVDIFRPGEGPGRWRNEDAQPLAAFRRTV